MLDDFRITQRRLFYATIYANTYTHKYSSFTFNRAYTHTKTHTRIDAENVRITAI